MDRLAWADTALLQEPFSLVDDQDGIVDHGPHQDQEAQHGDHVERLVKAAQAYQRQSPTHRVHQYQPDDAACDSQRDRGHDQQRVTPVPENGHQQQEYDDQRDRIIGRQGGLRGVQLVAGTGN